MYFSVLYLETAKVYTNDIKCKNVTDSITALLLMFSLLILIALANSFKNEMWIYFAILIFQHMESKSRYYNLLNMSTLVVYVNSWKE